MFEGQGRSLVGWSDLQRGDLDSSGLAVAGGTGSHLKRGSGIAQRRQSGFKGSDFMLWGGQNQGRISRERGNLFLKRRILLVSDERRHRIAQSAEKRFFHGF
jgi:hypothetical protein